MQDIGECVTIAQQTLQRFSTPEPTTSGTAKTTKQPTTKTEFSPGCTDVKPIVSNGNFETGFLNPWTVLDSSPALPEYQRYFSYNVTSPGYCSRHAFTMTDNLAATFVKVSIGQNITLCPGRKYKLSAQIFITDGSARPMKEQYLGFSIDESSVASAPSHFIQGPPIGWKSLSGEFTAKPSTAQVIVSFVATNYMVAKWGVDNVVITPLS
ncbi:MAG: hypothetical protein Q9215_000076 [Flavoplaca cf. flavocitrina]